MKCHYITDECVANIGYVWIRITGDNPSMWHGLFDQSIESYRNASSGEHLKRTVEKRTSNDLLMTGVYIFVILGTRSEWCDRVAAE